MEKLSASLEDYLEIIYNNEVLNQNLRPVDISKELNISRASVTEALQKLANKGYINYGRYQILSLTDFGRNTAEKIVSKHEILQDFFEKVLGLSKIEATENACKIEHVITENAYKKISEYIKFTIAFLSLLF